MVAEDQRFPSSQKQDIERLFRDLADIEARVNTLEGLSLRFESGVYRLPTTVVSDFESKTLNVAAYVYAWPFFTTNEITLELIRLRLVTAQAGAAAKVGVYSNQYSAPNELWADLGEVDLSAGSGSNKDLAATQKAFGAFWVLVFIKDVVTQVDMMGPKGFASAGQLPPVPADVLENGFAGCLAAAHAYPAGSLPDLAPALSPFSSLNAPVPLVKAT